MTNANSRDQFFFFSSVSLMTSAHRPTWTPAMGGNDQSGGRVLAPSNIKGKYDLTMNTTFKMRHDVETGETDITDKAALKRKLEEQEENARKVVMGLWFATFLILTTFFFFF